MIDHACDGIGTLGGVDDAGVGVAALGQTRLRDRWMRVVTAELRWQDTGVCVLYRFAKLYERM